MSRPSSRQSLIRDIADTQLGLITAAQLKEIGVPTSLSSRRTAGGMWTRVLPGVHLVSGGQPLRLQRERATMLYAGDPSMVTGLTAVRHYGLRALSLQEYRDDHSDTPEPVHALIPHARRRASTGFARIERTQRFPAEGVRRHGLALAPLPRAVGDAARRLRTASDVTALIAEVVQRGLASVEELTRELEEGPRRGSGLMRDALAAIVSGARSVPEADLVREVVAAAIPSAYFNVRLVTGSGQFVAVADCWLDDVGLPVELDSRAHHSDRVGFERTVRRNARYAAAGLTVVPILPTDLRDRPAATIATVLRAREAAARRPRPDVHMDTEQQRSAAATGWRWGA